MVNVNAWWCEFLYISTWYITWCVYRAFFLCVWSVLKDYCFFFFLSFLSRFNVVIIINIRRIYIVQFYTPYNTYVQDSRDNRKNLRFFFLLYSHNLTFSDYIGRLSVPLFFLPAPSALTYSIRFLLMAHFIRAFFYARYFRSYFSLPDFLRSTRGIRLTIRYITYNDP